METGLSIGSNLGDRLLNLQTACEKIASIDGVELTDQSSVYETEPVDVSADHLEKKYLNAFIVIESVLDPHILTRELMRVESLVGRVRTGATNEPRIIDIDIVYIADKVIVSDELTVPHPRWAERRFVVQPLSNIRPAIVLPGADGSASEVLLSLPETPKVVLYKEHLQ